MKNSQLKVLPKVLVVVHDAGGAEIIGAYIKKNSGRFDFRPYVAGPAKIIFRRLEIPASSISENEAEITHIVGKHADAKFALLGTGWMTAIEFDALVCAKAVGLKSVVYLESWVNYRERFKYPEKNWKKNLPDEIWVGDKYALALAKKYFTSTMVRYVPNQYFIAMKGYYRELLGGYEKEKGILFLSDVTKETDIALKQLLDILAVKEDPLPLLIRFHPADDTTRYDALIAQYRGAVEIKKSTEKYFVRDLLFANIVIGTETVAMVVSVLAGIKTISIMSVGKKPFLPFKEILHVRGEKAIARLI